MLPLKDPSLCVRCGLCASVCPLWEIERIEPLLPRGKSILWLELEKGSPLDRKRLRERLKACLLCNRCGRDCPTGVRGAYLTMGLRAQVGPSRLVKSLYRLFLKKRWALGLALNCINLFYRFLPPSKPPLRHLPHYLQFFLNGPRLPKLSPKPLSKLLPKVNPPLNERKMKVLLFSGCGMEYLFPHVALKAVRLLNQNGIEVIFPKEQGCCGMPLFGIGDLEGVKSLAEHNLEVLTREKADYVVGLCSSCLSSLKELYKCFFPELPKVEELSKKTLNLSQLLVSLEKEEFQSSLKVGTKVSYHDPCHTLNFQNLKDDPKRILRSLKDINFVEVPPYCCGMGGTFSLNFPSLSQAIGEKRIEQLKGTRAELILTDCPGCMLQLKDLVIKNGLSMEVLHWVEALKT